MKIEDFNPLWYNVFARKQIPPRKDEVLMQKIVSVRCPKCNNKDSFIVMPKIKMVIKNTFAVSVITNLLLINRCLDSYEIILAVLFVVKQHFYIMIMNITLIIVVVIKNVIILCLCINQLIYSQLQ